MTWWFWWTLGVATALVAVAVAAKLRRELQPLTPYCSWCTRMSGHEVTGHSTQQCRGPQHERQADERHHAKLRQLTADVEQQREQAAATKAARVARDASKMRVVQIGTITTQTGRRANTINISGWIFDDTHGPHQGLTPNGTLRPVTGVGSPERFHGWTAEELHAIAHGGSCTCDVVRLVNL